MSYLLMSCVQVALHGGNRVTKKPERHEFVRIGLMLNDDVDIPIFTSSGFKAVEHVAEIGAKAILDKAS